MINDSWDSWIIEIQNFCVLKKFLFSNFFFTNRKVSGSNPTNLRPHFPPCALAHHRDPSAPPPPTAPVDGAAAVEHLRSSQSVSNTVPCTVQCCTVLYSIHALFVLYQYGTMLYSTVLYSIHALFVLYQSLLSSLDSLFAYLDLLLHLYIDYRNQSLDSIDSLLYTLYLYI